MNSADTLSARSVRTDLADRVSAEFIRNDQGLRWILHRVVIDYSHGFDFTQADNFVLPVSFPKPVGGGAGKQAKEQDDYEPGPDHNSFHC